MNNRPIILAIDFDNTIVDVREFPHIHGFRKGAKQYINKLYEEGYYVIIWTCRTDNATCTDNSDAVRFLKENGVKFHLVNDNHYALQNHFGNNCRKISADIYVDDKGLWPFNILNWFWLYWMIKWKSKHLKKPALSYCNDSDFFKLN